MVDQAFDVGRGALEHAAIAPDRRYLAWGLGLTAVAAFPVFTGFTHIGWEIGEFSGLAATIACVALCGCPIRPRESTPPVLLSLTRHEWLGWAALISASLHIVVGIAADAPVIEYLKGTAPLYQLAGIVAGACLMALTIASTGALRRRLWRSHRNFQAIHILLACLLMPLLIAHVVTTNRYSGGVVRRAIVLAVAAAGIAMLLRRARRTAATPEGPSRRLVFGRHSTLVASGIGLALAALGMLLPGRVVLALREPVAARAATLPLAFDHLEHTAVNCLVCHHNYADGKGFESCIACHRSARADLKVGVEARFHSFCLDCHRNPAPGLKTHGPVSGCSVCHRSGRRIAQARGTVLAAYSPRPA